MKTVRIGCASAFILDSTVAVAQLLKAEPAVDYLMFDFMAEGTIGMMARARSADPDGGYARDIITHHIAPNLHEIVAKNVKLVANAGGMNPKGCAKAIEALLNERGISLKVGFVEGDDVLFRQDELRAATVADMFSGEGFPETTDSINVYLGAFPIAQALAAGADIVITGRCADSALALGPLIYEFGWRADDWDKLAAGTLVGHLLECGCQITGGTFTDWEEVCGWEDIGYPIADVAADGTCTIGKPFGTGGLVSIGTVAEQLLYEVSDPQAYIVPDVICDFSGVKLDEIGENQVSVSGARGRPATDTYKAVASYHVGWRGLFSQVIIGLDAVRKAECQGTALIARTRRILRDKNIGEFDRTHVDVIGGESAYGPKSETRYSREGYMRALVDHREKEAVELFVRESFLTTSAMMPGSTATISTAVSPLSRLFFFLTPKCDVTVTVTVGGETAPAPRFAGKPFDVRSVIRPARPSIDGDDDKMIDLPLIALAWGRSGDKGNLFNVAVIARQPEYLPYIRASLSVDRVAQCFAHLYPHGVAPHVTVFDVPGIKAINFIVHDSLDGGLLASQRVDSAAKGMAQQLLQVPVRIPSWVYHQEVRTDLDEFKSPLPL